MSVRLTLLCLLSHAMGSEVNLRIIQAQETDPSTVSAQTNDATRLAVLEKKVEMVLTDTTKNRIKIAELERSFSEMVELVAQLQNAQSRILTEIKAIKLQHGMAEEEPRSDPDSRTRRPRRTGVIAITNATATSQTITVNGFRHWIEPRVILEITVPTGRSTTKLLGEPTRTWNVGWPDYRQEIRIQDCVPLPPIPESAFLSTIDTRSIAFR